MLRCGPFPFPVVLFFFTDEEILVSRPYLFGH